MKIKGKNNKDYEYERVCIYFDKADERHIKSIKILNMMPKKKAAFISVLIEDFLDMFNKPINEQDIKAYIENRDTFKKFVSKQNNNGKSQVQNNMVSDTDNQTVSEKTDEKNNASEKGEDMDNIMDAMNMFSMN